MRVRFIATPLAISALAAAASIPLPAAARSRPCFPKGAKELASSKSGRVFSLPEGEWDIPYACLFKAGRRVRLEGRDDAVVTQPPYAIAGHYVASYGGYSEGTEGYFVIAVKNLKTKYQDFEDIDDLSGPVTAIVVDTRGHWAAIVADTSGGHTYEVRGSALNDVGVHQETTFARRSDIAPHSLRLRNGYLSWVQGSRRVSRRFR